MRSWLRHRLFDAFVAATSIYGAQVQYAHLGIGGFWLIAMEPSLIFTSRLEQRDQHATTPFALIKDHVLAQ